ncbi:MAG: LysM peptidoglycan-binding domain-containing protein [Sandaracinaceae bacterium]
MRARTLLVLLCLLGSLAVTSRTAAQADEPAGVEGVESEELRALRLFEQEIFGGQALAVAPDPAARLRFTDAPSALTSEAPAAPPTAVADGSRDLSWLRGLTLPDIPVRWDARVIHYLEFFRDDPRGQRFIRAWLRRVDRYGPMIRRQLEAAGLPRDLIFVAMVESGFDPTARSHAGAAGMWQFVRRTGEEFGLGVSHWADMRLDPEAATVAAGRYFTQLHARFGTWELAFAAYNMGYGALLRSIRKYNTNDYWALSHTEAALPFETTVYVAKIVACAIVANNPSRFGFDDLEREAPIEWDTVEVPGGTSLAQAARAAGTNLATLRRLNPALRRTRTPPGQAHALHLPAGSADRFRARFRRSGRAPHPHTIRFGETLASLARAAGTTESALRSLNDIEDSHSVGVGTTLLLPAGRTARRVSDDEPPVIAVPAGPRSLPGRRRVFYRVVRGDTAAEVARFFEVTGTELRRWNQIDPDAALQPGMFLQLFVPTELDLSRALVLTPDEVRVLVVGSEAFFAFHESQNGRVRFRYVVESGDTLSEIGQRFGLRTASLARINQISHRSTLHPGDVLVIYTERSRVPAEYRAEAIDGDALHPGGEATAERTEPAITAPEPTAAAPAEEPAADAPTESAADFEAQTGTDGGTEADADAEADDEADAETQAVTTIAA